MARLVGSRDGNGSAASCCCYASGACGVLSNCPIDARHDITQRTFGRSEKSCVPHESSTCGWSLRSRITRGCGFACSTECTGTENAG